MADKFEKQMKAAKKGTKATQDKARPVHSLVIRLCLNTFVC